MIFIENLRPLELKPPVKDYIWGGTKLRDEFGRESDSERLAESWELSCHKDGMSVISGGEYDGKTLAEYLEMHRSALGTDCADFEYFPVLIKLIDAKNDLSVQVHPDNEYALEHEGEYGKTEMWYVVDCEPDAELIYGFRESISREEFRRAIEENTLLDKVNRVKVRKGDVFFIKSGTLHAIGKGLLIAEIQQNSNTTYRVYDYGRLGADGKPRELHIEKAIEVTDLKPADQRTEYPVLDLSGRFEGTSVRILADCEYFTSSLVKLGDSQVIWNIDESSFRHVLVIEGSGEMIHGEIVYPLRKGSSYFIPAGAGEVTFKGKCSFINTEINKQEEI